MTLLSDIQKPKTQRGKRFLKNKASKLVENDKQTLLIKGGHTSETVNEFMKNLYSIKKPLAIRLKWRNPVLPFEDISFIEKMCAKYDCSLFVVGLHSKKRPNNIVIGRLHDGELLDMYELGIKNFIPLTASKENTLIYGAKPLLLFSSELFHEDKKNSMMRSLLADLFRGPNIEKIRSLGVEHQIHFILKSNSELLMRVRKISLSTVNISQRCEPEPNSQIISEPATTLRTPGGKVVQISLEDSSPNVDFELRRFTLPSEDKWKRAHRLPPEIRSAERVQKNKSLDVFGSRVARVHVGRSTELDILRPGASLRSALTGHRKKGIDKPNKSTKQLKNLGNVQSESNPNKRRKLYKETTW